LRYGISKTTFDHHEQALIPLGWKAINGTIGSQP